MHIEPGVVDGAKIFLSYGTAAVAFAGATWFVKDAVRRDGYLPLIGRSFIAALLVFCCFEVLPHHAVGVSEVHLIVGTTLFLLFGPAAAALGLTGGLLAQGLFFAPSDLPQYGMNVTTLLVPLFGITILAKKIIAPDTPYVDLTYAQTFKLSVAYQGGIVAWVAFWALYGHGLTAENLSEIASFGGAYLLVVTVEPLIDLGVLAIAKALHGLRNSPLLERRLYATHG
jgi:ABC-type Co2+ transport system permease subunit